MNSRDRVPRRTCGAKGQSGAEDNALYCLFRITELKTRKGGDVEEMSYSMESSVIGGREIGETIIVAAGEKEMGEMIIVAPATRNATASATGSATAATTANITKVIQQKELKYGVARGFWNAVKERRIVTEFIYVFIPYPHFSFTFSPSFCFRFLRDSFALLRFL